jgi:transketolase
VRVVSMPSWDLFDEQDDEYCDAVIPPDALVISVEAGATLGWERYADLAIGIDRFGASAPGATVLHELGISTEAVVEQAREVLELAGEVE